MLVKLVHHFTTELMEISSLFPVLFTSIFLIIGGLPHNGKAQPMDCLESDREALIDFRNGLRDPDNQLSSWRGKNSCCQWSGIRCDNRTGAVIAVDLHNPHRFAYGDKYKISGEIRPSLMQLKSLRYLDLSFNEFNGTAIPTFIQSIEKLQYLNLKDAAFGGTIPPNLGNVSTLHHLDVSYNNLVSKNLEWLTTLRSLKYLALDQVDISVTGEDLVGVLNMLPNLTELHLSTCGLNNSFSFLNFVNLSSLAVIDLSSNNFGSMFPNWLLNISSLVSVDVYSSMSHGIIPLGLSELPNLQSLDLSENYLTSDGFQLFKGSWRRLKDLSLRYNYVHGNLPASIGNMSSLTYLDLSKNSIEGEIPSTIGKLCNLEYIDISSNFLRGSLKEILRGAQKCPFENPFPRLENLLLSNNLLIGKLPNWLGQLQSLLELRLENNLFQGSIPASLGMLRRLTTLVLNQNELNGTLPDSLGQISGLTVLDVSYNHLTGVVSDTLFSKLKKLKSLILSSNSFILNVSSDWVRPFQVEALEIGSCYLGLSFPSWLKSQRDIKFLDFSNTGISGSIPSWLWNISANLSLLNFSSNHLQGQLPNPLKVYPNAFVDLSFNLFHGPIPLPAAKVTTLSISNNIFSGHIPKKIGEFINVFGFLSFASNQLTGEIPGSIGDSGVFMAIDLSRNKLTGRIPKSLGYCLYLRVLDLQDNNLSGMIPSSLGGLNDLQILHLRNNRITGKIPSSFRHLLNLETLDIGNNRITGKIPQWMGDAFPSLRILSLRSNALSGKIPSTILNLTSLHVLDLADNGLSGAIPTSLGSLKAMTTKKKINRYLVYGKVGDIYYEENMFVSVKGQSLQYTKTLSLLTCIDLSGNDLHGELPLELTKLTDLIVLNLSRNHINGQISQNISELHQLSSLDLSSNMLSGPIPSSMSSLSFLGHLNLSNNNFSGRIPYTGHMTTFEAYSFLGNPGLCGAPLLVQCADDNSTYGGSFEKGSGDIYNVDKLFYLIVGLGYAAGILVPYFILASNRNWSHQYFAFVDKTAHRLSYFGSKIAACFRTS